MHWKRGQANLSESRNYSCGIEIGKLDSGKAFLEHKNKTVEGVYACKMIDESSIKLGIDMPITRAVYEVLYEDKKPSNVIVELMNRKLREE